LEKLVFEEKTEEPGEKLLGARTRTSNKLNPHMKPGTGIESWPGECSHHCVIPAPPVQDSTCLYLEEARYTFLAPLIQILSKLKLQ